MGVVRVLYQDGAPRDLGPEIAVNDYFSDNSSIRSGEGLTLETSDFQSLYGGQFTLSTPLINQIFVYFSDSCDILRQ